MKSKNDKLNKNDKEKKNESKINKEKTKTKNKKVPVYTYIASKSHPKILNSFIDKKSEEKCLECLKELFTKRSKIEKIDLIPSNIEDLKIFYKRYVINSEETSSFLMRTKLKKLFKEEHLSDQINKDFWNQFIFGFNSIMRKLERGVAFDLILLDGVLADAPIISHFRELASKNNNNDVIIISFESGGLLNAVDSQYRQFGKILSMSIPKGDSKMSEDISQFIDLIKRNVEHFKVTDEKIEISTLPETPTTTLKVDPIENKTFSPYVFDEVMVEELHSKHEVIPKEENIKKPIPEIDFLSQLQRVKQVKLSTKLIKPPNQEKPKKRKFQNKF